MNVRWVGIITSPANEKLLERGAELAAWFEQRRISASLNVIEPGMDMLVVLGGDGTLLHVAAKASEYALPVVGVNLGHLGFLTEIAGDEIHAALGTVLVDDVRVERRMMLSATVVRGGGGGKSETLSALNEVVVVKDSTEAMIRLRCWADKEYVTTYRADGLIVSTPTGSTAYNLSAGGPIVHAELNTIALTPICPFMLGSRPVLLGPQTKITAQLLAPAGEVKVLIDGEQQWKMTENDYLLVQRAAQPLLIVSSPWKSYFNILRTKLNWGGDNVDLPLPLEVHPYS